MDAPRIPKFSDGVITLTFFAASDAPVLLEADGDAEHRRRFDFPDDFVPSLQHSETVIARACEVAVAEFDFRSLQIVADPDNIPSRQTAARNGFEEVGEQDGRILYTLEVRDRRARALRNWCKENEIHVT